MKKKYEILNFNLKELDLLERHLNNMAKNHWHLKWISNYIICYEYNECDIHYYIDYNQFSSYDKDKEENRIEEQNQINFYDDLGYKFVCSFDYYSIYKSETELEEIHTNQEIKKEFFEYVKNRTTKYNCFILFVYILFLFFAFYFYPKGVLLSFFDFTAHIFALSFFITIYFTIYNLYNKRQTDLDKIKKRTIRNLLLQIIQCILLYLFTILVGTRFSSFIICVGYYCIYCTQNILYFHSIDRKYKHVPFITKFIPYIVFCIIVFCGLANYERDIDYQDEYNKNYPQEIINTGFLPNNAEVYHYNEKDSFALHMIETRLEDYQGDEINQIVNVFYYNDKTGLLKPLILKYFTLYKEENLKHIATIDNTEIKSIDKDELEINDDFSDLILIKNHQYVRVRITDSFTKDAIHQLIDAINWK